MHELNGGDVQNWLEWKVYGLVDGKSRGAL